LDIVTPKKKTELCYDKTGWYKSDDVGFMKSNGCLVVAGRKSDMMIISGECLAIILRGHFEKARMYFECIHLFYSR